MKRPYASFLNTALESKINELVTIRDVEQLELMYSELEHQHMIISTAVLVLMKSV